MGPEAFEELIDGKQFTNGADSDAVKRLYRKLSTELLKSAVMLDYEGMPPPSAGESGVLASCLNMCERLESLDLQSVRMNDESAVALFTQLSDSALPRLASLQLQDNDIDGEGMDALAEALHRGAMRTLRANHISYSEASIAERLAHARESGINEITSGLNLSQNPGDSGVVFAELAMVHSS